MVLPGPKSSFHGIPLHGILLHGIPIHEIPLCGILVHESPTLSRVSQEEIQGDYYRGKFDFIVYCVAVMYGTSNSS